MRLSTKFFCIAYTIVLLSTGLGGTFLIRYIDNTLWNARREQADNAVWYAAEIFTSFADISAGEISEMQKEEILRQIDSATEGNTASIALYTADNNKEEYAQLKDHEFVSQFFKEGGFLLLETVCRLDTGTNIYYLALRFDFTEVERLSSQFWKIYGFVVFGISAISGFVLFFLTKRATKPLWLLTNAADEIALGNYQKRVNIKSTDYEIVNLSESFNSMSDAIEQKIMDLEDEIEKRNRFTSDFTHELKTPMTAIIGYSQMLKTYELDESEKKEAAGAIYTEARRLEKLSLQLLDLYVFRHEDVELEELNLLTIGEHLKSTLKYVSRKYDVPFSVHFQKECVCANQVLLLSLLYNLADNAFKASESKNPIRIYSKSNARKVRIYIEDHGRGIDSENIKHITEPFFREDKSRSRKLGGAGLGLSLCSEIAALHGTKLHFQSEKGEGCTVFFTLKKGNLHEK